MIAGQSKNRTLVRLVLGFGAAALMITQAIRADAVPAFQEAEPIWPEGREKEKNLTVGFRACFDSKEGETIIVRLTGATLYRAFLNGEFLAYGPARGPHGYYRVDEIEVTKRVKRGQNVLAVEVAGYNVNSYYVLNQPSFLQAEVVSGGTVLAATGNETHPFPARVAAERIQKVQRYSFQRPFSEVYRLSPGYDRWRFDPNSTIESARCVVQPAKALLPRRVAFSAFEVRNPVRTVSSGELRTGLNVPQPWKDRSLTAIGPTLGGYVQSELVTIPSLELQMIGNSSSKPVDQPYSTDKAISLKGGSFTTLDLGVNDTGFVGARLHCSTRTRLFFTFDEILTNDDVDFKRLGCVNIVAYELAPGDYDVESFEPYTLRYLKLVALEGDCTIENVHLREYVSKISTKATFSAGDERLNRLFAAGVETFRQNTVDIFMDCPSRERAGWLCDSFFTARVALDLQGKTRIEKNVFENYQLPKSFAHLPDGMLPMCYPADHDDGVFIPNWALWFVVQLEEYQKRSGDDEMVKALGPRLEKLMDYFRRFQNSDGLLEKLESWVFVEWSKANEFVQDVNYPSNMLYASALAAMGNMYGRADYVARANQIRDVIRKQSFDGEFFVDNAVRKDGRLQVTRNRSEVCQYFAFFFDVATPASHPKLWHTLITDFGPQRKQTKLFPDVHPANAFVGNTMRLELLSRGGLCQQLLDESLAYQLFMVERTGTLWENDSPAASCNHGFASHGGVHVLLRDVLGFESVDQVQKKVKLRFADQKLDRCEGSLPVPGGALVLRWHKEGKRLVYQIETPPDYSVEVSNESGLELVPGK